MIYTLNGIIIRYNETVFRALDRVLADAAQHRIKVILVFANNWDGKDLPPGTHNDGTIAQVGLKMTVQS